MDKPQLLAGFKAQLEAFDKFQGFIDKAREKADKFRPEVVEKVVRDNTAKIEGVKAELDPLVAEIDAVVAGLASDRLAVEAESADARLGLEELELRREIGELDDAAFDAEAANFKGAIGESDGRLASIDAELADFRAVLEAWAARRGTPIPAAAPAVEDDLLGDLEDDVDEAAFAGEDDRGAAVHLTKTEIADDVSVVFDDEPAAPSITMTKPKARAVDEEDEEVIEAAEAPSVDEGISFGDDELSDLGGDVPAQPAAATDYAGQAVLIMGEGTDEEHVFPFAAGVISLGRGRDNTVQVKNDSKVSRYHCKVFQRDTSYFIEDNKSANGTLVDGELITEKRLLGGEEIIVGETFFRFRINP
jgi:hypothetical protein